MNEPTRRRRHVFSCSIVDGFIKVPDVVQKFVRPGTIVSVTIEHEDNTNHVKDSSAASYLDALDDVHDTHP